MLGAAQRADAAGDGGIQIRASAGDHPRGEGRGVELVLRIEIERDVHGAHPALRRLLAMQQAEEMAADAVVVGLDIDADAAMRVVVPGQQHRPERGQQPVGDLARTGGRVVVLFRQHAAERRHSGAHHIHRMRRRRQRFQHLAHGGGQPAQAPEAALVGGKLGAVRQPAMHQQMRDLLELAGGGDVDEGRSRDSAGRCRCGLRSTARCCRRPRRTARPTFSASEGNCPWRSWALLLRSAEQPGQAPAKGSRRDRDVELQPARRR